MLDPLDPIRLYDVTQNVITGQAGISFGSWANWIDAVSPNGSLVAAADRHANTTTVWDHSLNAVYSGLPGGAVFFSPTYNTLYILKTDSNTLLAYDTQTFALKATFDVGDGYSYFNGPGNQPEEGEMAASADGKTLFIVTNNGVEVLNVDESQETSVSLAVSAPTVIVGSSLTLLATVGLGNSATGSVVFSDGNTVLGTVAASGGVARLTVSSLFAGTHDLTASYIALNGATSISSVVPVVAFASNTLSNFLPIGTHTDLILNAARNELYIPSANGDIFRYDVTNQKVLSAFHVNGSPTYGDVTTDGNFLYLADGLSDVIHKVNLSTGISTDLSYTTSGSGEAGPVNLVIVSSTLAIFDSYQNGSGNSYTLHTIDLTTDTIGMANSSLLSGSASADSFLYRSADRNTILLDRLSGSDDPITLFNVPSNSILGQGNVSFGWWRNWIAAVSRDGKLVATTDTNAGTTSIRNRQLGTINSTLPGGAVYFSPVSDKLFIYTPAGIIDVYDTNTFNLIASYNIGESYSYNSSNGLGLMALIQ